MIENKVNYHKLLIIFIYIDIVKLKWQNKILNLPNHRFKTRISKWIQLEAQKYSRSWKVSKAQKIKFLISFIKLYCFRLESDYKRLIEEKN